jgi:hypothetical protein
VSQHIRTFRNPTTKYVVAVTTSFKVPASPSKTSGGSGRIRASPSGTSLHSGGEHIKHVSQSKFDTSNWRCLCELVSEGTKTNIVSSPMFHNPITTSVTLRPGRTVYVTQLILVVFEFQ